MSDTTIDDTTPIKDILEDLHFKCGLPLGFVNDGETHTVYNHATGDGCTDEAEKAIQTYIDTAVQEARIELATDLLRKVKLEYEAGGRYSGHIILPWEEIVRPELVKLKSTSKEDK